METKYDILVIGSEISGLISSALLLKKGLRVAVVSIGEYPSIYEKKGYRFNKEPLLITGVYGGPLGKVFDDIGIKKEGFAKTGVSYQVVLPEERIDVFEESVPFKEELRRCFPKEIDRVSAFYEHLSGFGGAIEEAMGLNPFSFRLLLPSEIRQGKRAVKEMTEGFGLSPGFQSFIRAQVSSFSYLAGTTSSLAASSLLDSYRKGIYNIEGGADGLKNLLLDKIRALGGDLIKSPARDISRNGNRWLLRTEEEALSGRAVIGNAGASNFCGLFLDGVKNYVGKVGRIEKAFYPLTVNLGVKETGVPVGMAENVIIYKDCQKEPILDNLVFMQTAPAGDGRRILSFVCHIPKGEFEKDKVREMTENVLEGVERLCPFIDRHTELLDVRYPEPHGNGIFVTSLNQRMGVGVLPYEMVRGEIFFTGPEVFPALGFDGLVYSGEMAASAALKGLERGKA